FKQKTAYDTRIHEGASRAPAEARRERRLQRSEADRAIDRSQPDSRDEDREGEGRNRVSAIGCDLESVGAGILPTRGVGGRKRPAGMSALPGTGSHASASE